jgi:hypothetical protein
MPRMNLDAMIARMEGTPGAIAALTAGLADPDARFRPPSGAWSILEIINHLADEEADDFRARLVATLAQPQQPWAPIDPEGWARQRRYNERDVAESIARFAAERARSVGFLRGLQAPDWGRAHAHPSLGTLRAGDLMCSWAAHDALHVRQIGKRLHDLARRDAPGFAPDYAGPLVG